MPDNPPVLSSDDVKAEWSADVLNNQTGPNIPAVIDGETALLVAYQDAAAYAAAQSDPLRATGEYLDEVGWERDIHRIPGELDATYSPRVNALPAVTDPNDILAAVNAILAPYTATQARYSERSDAWFVSDGTASWSSHVFEGVNRAPNYPDRCYVDAVAPGRLALPGRRPGGARVFSDNGGRYFEIRIPDLAPVNRSVPCVFDGTQSDDLGGLFAGGDGAGLPGTFTVTHGSTAVTASTTLAGLVSVGQGVVFVQNGTADAQCYRVAAFDGTTGITLASAYAGTVAAPTTAKLDPGATSFVWSSSDTENQIYDRIISAVEQIRGHSIRWTLLADPNLGP